MRKNKSKPDYVTAILGNLIFACFFILIGTVIFSNCKYKQEEKAKLTATVRDSTAWDIRNYVK